MVINYYYKNMSTLSKCDIPSHDQDNGLKMCNGLLVGMID